MKKLLLHVIVVLITVFSFFQVTYGDELNIIAKAYILIDSKTGQVLYEHNAHEKLYPASTTKIMTGILALEKGDLNQKCIASASAVNSVIDGGMNIGIMPGEEIRLEDLVNALLVRSANETAYIIAENLAPSLQDFVDLMNKKAVELGALDTHFVNPCGMDTLKKEAGHLTTASDLAKIARYAMTLPKFREIVSKEYFDDMAPTNKHSEWPPLQSTNKLLWYNREYPYTMKDTKLSYTVNGIKTGFTNRAGSCLVSSAYNSDGMELLSVILGVNNSGTEETSFGYTKRIFEYGFSHYLTQKVVAPNTLIETVHLENANDNGILNLVTGSELMATLPLDTNEWKIEKKEYLNENISAPVAQNQILGYVEYEREGVVLGRVNVIASRTINEFVPPTITKKALDTMRKTAGNPILKVSILAVLSLLLIFIMLRFTLRKISRKLNARR